MCVCLQKGSIIYGSMSTVFEHSANDTTIANRQGHAIHLADVLADGRSYGCVDCLDVFD